MQSIKDALHIFGPSVPNLQGKITRSSQNHVRLQDITPIPPIILQRHRNIVIGMDMVNINKVRFFVTYSRDVKFSTATALQDASIPTIVKILTTIKAIYAVRQFNVTYAAADNAFMSMHEDPNFLKLRITLNVTSEDDTNPILSGSIVHLRNAVVLAS